MTKGTTALEQGDVVLTTGESGTDFGLPLVQPWRGPRLSGEPRQREVRGHLRVRGGTVIWFTDGTKSEPVHGRTAWVLP